MMRTGEKFSIGDISESLRKRVGKTLGFITVATLVVSGCTAPTSETKPAGTEQGQEDTQTDSKGRPDLDWTPVDSGCGRDCEEGEPGGSYLISKACDGTTLLYLYQDYYSRGGITAVPNSPKCGYIPPTLESSPTPTAEATSTTTNGN